MLLPVKKYMKPTEVLFQSLLHVRTNKTLFLWFIKHCAEQISTKEFGSCEGPNSLADVTNLGH